MIRGVGIDLVENERVARALETYGERFEKRVFTDAERAQCALRGDRVQALAARFAAKEACLKALGTGYGAGLGLKQIEVVRAGSGAPSLRLHGAAFDLARRQGIVRTHVSLTHQPLVSAAVVVLEAGPGVGEGDSS